MGWFGDLLSVVVPRRCALCGEPLTEWDNYICAGCLASLPRTGYHRKRMNAFEERFAGLFPFERATGHFFYSRSSEVAKLIHAAKYRSLPGVGEMLGHTVGCELYTTGFFDDASVIVPVPVHWLKFGVRGYNQVFHIARGLSRATGLPVLEALRAERFRSTQTALGRSERFANAAHSYRLRRAVDVSGLNVLLVDDVCTTGATLASAAEALHAGRIGKLTLLTVGVTF